MKPSRPSAPLSWMNTLRQQFILYVRSGRAPLLIAACAAMTVLVNLVWTNVVQRAIYSREVPDGSGDLQFAGSGMTPPINMVLVGLVLVSISWALLSWRDEQWGKRDYHWSLPVGRLTHDMLRIVAGCVVLIVAVAVCLGVDRLLELSDSRPFSYLGRTSELPIDQLPTDRYLMQQPGGAFYGTFIFVPVLVYLYVSALVVVVRKPIEWMVGSAVVFTAVVWAAEAARLEWVLKPLRDVSLKDYGLLRTLDGVIFTTVEHAGGMVAIHSYRDPSGSFTLRFLIWYGVAFALLLIALNRENITARVRSLVLGRAAAVK